MRAEFTLPLRLVSEANERIHWAKKSKRTKTQRTASYLASLESLRAQGVSSSGPISAQDKETLQVESLLPLWVQITRVAPRSLDTDNLAGACKHVRDGIADALGVDDRHSHLVAYSYAQAKGPAKHYEVRVVIAPLSLLSPATLSQDPIKAPPGAVTGETVVGAEALRSGATR
jgi:hypothetical protein